MQDIRPVTEPAASKHSIELKALTLTDDNHPLDLGFS